MAPSFNDGDVVFLQKFNKNPIPGDVVVFEYANERFVKRLITLENAEIYVDNFRLFVNGAPFTESDGSQPQWDSQAFDCRFSEVFKNVEGRYFLMGDNRCFSYDSRFLGGIEKNSIVGKVRFTLIPSKWNWLRQIFR
jgi:signal peptidase I